MFSLAWWEASGIFKTYPEATFIIIDPQRESGILHWEGFKQVENFSNSPNVAPLVPEVQFNKYIHYLPEFPYHRHMTSPENNIESPDYTDPSVTLLKLRNEQERKYIEVEYLTDVTKRTSPSNNNNQIYVYDEDGLFPKVKIGTDEPLGRCEYPDGECRNNISAEACSAYPGAIWTSGEFCDLD